jgi:DeoR/GlpR family transcriptional regulator of sugar metabolism
MPRISDKIPINNPKLDRRIKLTAEDKELIKWLREEEQISYQKLANQFNVSKRTIIFICKPETLEACKKARKERGGSKIYYNKEKHTDATKEHREYKKELYGKGLIKKK